MYAITWAFRLLAVSLSDVRVVRPQASSRLGPRSPLSSSTCATCSLQLHHLYCTSHLLPFLFIAKNLVQKRDHLKSTDLNPGVREEQTVLSFFGTNWVTNYLPYIWKIPYFSSSWFLNSPKLRAISIQPKLLKVLEPERMEQKFSKEISRLSKECWSSWVLCIQPNAPKLHMGERIERISSRIIFSLEFWVYLGRFP